ncbi:MAG: phosphoribosylamine--glycine ligase [Paracoccaceae bacterium]
MKILIIGSGAREHALTWAISQNPRCAKIYCSPGNAGTATLATNLDIDVTSNDKILDICLEYSIDMVVVGPEKQFEQGLTNALKEKNILVFGPTKEASQLETSKSFTKIVCKHKNIPTGNYEIFSKEGDAIEFLRAQPKPFVIKADGLAAGKGVLVSSDFEEGNQFISSIFDGKIGIEKNKVIIEEYLEGQEVSVFFAIDKNTIKYIGSAQDYKRAFDHDRGPNTGGMGAFSPSPLLTEKNLAKIVNKIVKPTVEYMRENVSEFSGILYAGLILNKGEPKLIEYNVRFGDPECQALCIRLGAQILDIYFSGAKNELSNLSINEANDSAITVIVAEKGYPENPKSGCELNDIVNTKYDNRLNIFHAGTYFENNFLRNSGGRIFSFTARSANLRKAREIVYKQLNKIENENIFYRTDIASD